MSRCPFLRETRLNLNKIKQTFITLQIKWKDGIGVF